MSGKNLTILVTGGGGYVGSHTVVELLHNDYNVIVIDNLVNCFATAKNDKPVALHRVERITGKTTQFHNVDIRDKEKLSEIFKSYKIDCVIHFAALKAVGESVQLPLQYYHNNVVGTTTLLEVMKENNVKMFIFSSSATVYGDPKFLPITEEHPTGQGCSNPYGKTKFIVEEILKDVCTADPEFRVISLRYFNPVGAHESGIIGEDPTGIPNNLMPYISQVAVGIRPMIKVFGSDYDTPDGTGVRDYIHIKDLSDGHIAGLNKITEPNFKGFKAYNLGTGKGYSVMEVISAYAKASGENIKYETVGRREGDIAACYADASLAKKELKWEAKKTLDDMCVDSWRWQRQNPTGYKPVN